MTIFLQLLLNFMIKMCVLRFIIIQFYCKVRIDALYTQNAVYIYTHQGKQR